MRPPCASTILRHLDATVRLLRELVAGAGR
jgi:hypothetical protein